MTGHPRPRGRRLLPSARGAGLGPLGLLGLLGLLAAAAPAVAAAAAPADPLIGSARLVGVWGMLGTVTRAVGVPGEHRGQIVRRGWTFDPLCPAGQCPTVHLERARAHGTDSILLTLRRPGYYTGSGAFYAPARCHRISYRKGDLVPFTVTVRITEAVATGTGATATRVTATYRNARRIGLTRCVTPPSYDSARYLGAPFTTAASIRSVPSTRSRTASRRRRSGPEAAMTT